MKKIFTLLLLCSFLQVYSQKHFQLTVKTDSTIDKKKLVFYCNNGETLIYPTDTFRNGLSTIKGVYYSKFVTVTMAYNGSSELQFFRQFWIKDNPATIILTKKDTEDLFVNCKRSNMIDIDEENKELLKSLHDYTMNELKKMSELWEHQNEYKNRAAFDSVQKQLFIALMNKSAQYIKKHNSEYFYFWEFLDQFYGTARGTFKKDTILNLTVRDSLLSIFAPSLATSFEARRAVKEIDDYFFPKINVASPNFNAKSIKGLPVSLDQYKGKYVLLDFWASWCPPCMREVPFFKKIRAEFPPKQLVIIGVNKDKTLAACRAAVSKYALNWDHVFDDEDKLRVLFGVSVFPTTILINGQGIIIYNSAEKNDKEKLVSLLKRM